MIPKSGSRFSERIMLQRYSRARWRFEEKSSRSGDSEKGSIRQGRHSCENAPDAMRAATRTVAVQQRAAIPASIARPDVASRCVLDGLALAAARLSRLHLIAVDLAYPLQPVGPP